jgi:MFS family permease
MLALYRQHRFLVLFAVLSSLMGTSVGLATVTTSLYAIDLGASEVLFGSIAAAQMVGTLFMSVPIGFLVDHAGPARLFMLGSALAGLTYALIPLVPSPHFLLACTAAVSFFMPLRFVSLNTVFFHQLQSIGEAKAGWYRGTHMTGMFLLGPLLAPLIIAWAGFAVSYWTIAAIFATTILVSPIVFRRYAEGATQNRNTRFSFAELRAELALLSRDRELRQANIIDFFTQAAHAYFSFFIIAIAINVLHFDRQHAAALVTGCGVSFILALFFLGGLSARFGQQRVLLGACGVVGAGLSLLGLASGAGLLWSGALVLGLGLGALQVVNLTRLARAGARLGQGKVSGLNSLIGPAGAVVGALLGGVLGKIVGRQTVFLLLIPVFALLAWKTGASREPLPVPPAADVAPQSAAG